MGVGDLVRRRTVPVYGRIIHEADGHTTYQGYGLDNQALYAIMRDELNDIVMRFARDHYQAPFHFDQKCRSIDLHTNTITFEDTRSGAVTQRHPGIILGADGAFSTVRAHLQRTPRFNYSQHYIEYGYKELTIARPDNQGWLAQKNAIHFWPRGHYMLMGFANFDGSFTFSLHLPLEGELSFAGIATREDMLRLLRESFPDVLPQAPELVNSYFTNAVNSMVTVRCQPWSHMGRIGLIGDAAHAIVPYYGQGANAGFEDCAVLDECLARHPGDWPRVLEEFEDLRRPNTNAIADLGLDNFIELRDRMCDPRFRLRKKLENMVYQRHPDKYTTLYSMIAFSSIPYREALRIDQRQRQLIDRIMQTPRIDHMDNSQLCVVVDSAMVETIEPLPQLSAAMI